MERSWRTARLNPVQTPMRLTRPVAERGQALVEFTLSLPLFLALLLGLLGMSLLFYSYVTVTLAAREGASALVHNPQQTVAQIQTVVRNTSISLDRNALTVSVEPNDPSLWVSGEKISVTANYLVPLPTLQLPDLRGNRILILAPITIRAVSNMTID